MSRNKMIKFVHETTGLSYGECRRLLKKYDWDVWKASGMESVLDTFLESMKPLIEACTALANSMAEAIGSIDWSAIAEAIIKAKEEKEND